MTATVWGIASTADHESITDVHQDTDAAGAKVVVIARRDGATMVAWDEYDADGNIDGYTYSVYAAGSDEEITTDGGTETEMFAADLAGWAGAR